MENFTASNKTQWEYITNILRECDYYILIVGHRYGTINEEYGMSYTEMEFDFALSLNIPILAFVIDRDKSAPLPMADRETADHEGKLQRFINEKVRVGRINAKNWTTPDHLAALVSASLSNEIQENPRVGWVRADREDIEYLKKEIARLTAVNKALATQSSISLSEQKEPNFTVLLNGESELHLERFKISFEKEQFEHLNFEDLDTYLRKHITEEEVDRYNQMIPSHEEVHAYNQVLETYTRIQHTRFPLDIVIINDGTLKADSIYVDLEFPEEIVLLVKGTAEQLDKPIRPKHFPKDIVKEARNKMYEKIDSLIDRSFIMGQHFNVNFRPPLGINIGRLMNQNSTYNLWVDDNKVTMRLDSLLHTRQKKFDDEVELVALKQGEYEIKASVICEQYPEPKEFIIPITVTESAKEHVYEDEN